MPGWCGSDGGYTEVDCRMNQTTFPTHNVPISIIICNYYQLIRSGGACMTRINYCQLIRSGGSDVHSTMCSTCMAMNFSVSCDSSATRTASRYALTSALSRRAPCGL